MAGSANSGGVRLSRGGNSGTGGVMGRGEGERERGAEFMRGDAGGVRMGGVDDIGGRSTLSTSEWMR